MGKIISPLRTSIRLPPRPGRPSLPTTIHRAISAVSRSFRKWRRTGRSTKQPCLFSGTDSKLYLPFYHFEGYDSGVALANPTNASTRITIQALNNVGSIILTDSSIVLAGYGHIAFDLLSRYPSLNNVRGNLYITSSSGALSAVGLRFSPTGSYTTIPIMNWPGMFQ